MASSDQQWNEIYSKVALQRKRWAHLLNFLTSLKRFSLKKVKCLDFKMRIGTHPIVISDTLDTCYDQKHLASSLLMTSWQWASFICCCIASGHLEAPPIKANLFAIQRSVNFNLAHGHSISDSTLILWFFTVSEPVANSHLCMLLGRINSWPYKKS